MFFRRNHVKKEERPSEHNRETDRYYFKALDKDDFLILFECYLRV